jgi:hypothetical protein
MIAKVWDGGAWPPEGGDDAAASGGFCRHCPVGAASAARSEQFSSAPVVIVVISPIAASAVGWGVGNGRTRAVARGRSDDLLPPLEVVLLLHGQGAEEG